MDRKIRIYNDDRIVYTTLKELLTSPSMPILGKLEFHLHTGFKDKNGVDIYEGDIIQAKNMASRRRHENHHRIVWPDIRTGKTELFFVTNPYEITLRMICCADGLGMREANAKKFTVLGNHIENPELIDKFRIY